MFGLFAQLLDFFYSLIPSYGAAIALLTALVMVIVTPFTLKATRSMMMTQLVAPEIRRLQTQYKDDRQKLNEEMMRFYKENNINPLSGCLPMLIQIPVFIVLYRVLHGLTKITENVADLPEGVTRGFSPAYLSKDGDLFQSLWGKLEMKSWGMDLSRSVPDLMRDSFGKAVVPLMLVLVVGALSYIQQRQIMSRNPGAASNPQQQLLMKLSPVMITFFSLIVPCGLSIYFLVSNGFRVAQQAIISRTIYSTPEAARLREIQEKQLAEQAKDGGAPKGFFKSILGDAAPRMDEVKARAEEKANAKAAGSGNAAKNKQSKATTKPAAKAGSGSTNPRPSSGRTTPPGSRSQTARKKKRK